VIYPKKGARTAITSKAPCTGAPERFKCIINQRTLIEVGNKLYKPSAMLAELRELPVNPLEYLRGVLA
jgi:hypothetical protein